MNKLKYNYVLAARLIFDMGAFIRMYDKKVILQCLVKYWILQNTEE